MFILRALFQSLWIFLLFLVIRVWELNFEVSPLPAWTLVAFVYLVFFFITFFFARRSLKKTELASHRAAWIAGIFILGTTFWEIGLALILPGGDWESVRSVFTGRYFLVLGLMVAAVFIARSRLAHLRERAKDEEELHGTTAPVAPPSPQEEVVFEG